MLNQSENMINTERSAPFPLDADNISSLFNTAKIEDYRRLMTYYRCAIMEIETKFNVLRNFHFNMTAIQ